MDPVMNLKEKDTNQQIEIDVKFIENQTRSPPSLIVM